MYLESLGGAGRFGEKSRDTVKCGKIASNSEFLAFSRRISSACFASRSDRCNLVESLNLDLKLQGHSKKDSKK